MAADNLALAIAELGALSERRTALLIDSSLSQLPPFLVEDAGQATTGRCPDLLFDGTPLYADEREGYAYDETQAAEVKPTLRRLLETFLSYRPSPG